ncbi:hypothetical protein [Aminipila sp.]|uniref:hypothetical protein n=1 Tax=Aminipila sp. TaxID=2060095 RepID=UPI00289ED9FB|nr:hypothetical protein [Aminipila sp.]
MTKKIDEAYKHCFAHICASGVTTLMTLQEVLNTYADLMCKDLEDCGVNADKKAVTDYIAEQYSLLKGIQNKDTDIIRM